ncbi:hypothetical protein, partial [Klebsiella pneumoniae]|uniref:hypothetical protein n=1 Tax=Klebsiella pneumoniae TaxID=573 RepID=UPI0019673FA3
LDARGNKPGVNAKFSLDEEHLAFQIRDYYEEMDYPVMYTAPHPKTIDVLRRHSDCIQKVAGNAVHVSDLTKQAAEQA